MLLKRWVAAGSGLVKRALPGYCAFCLATLEGEASWCSACYEQLPWNWPACPCCGDQLTSDHQALCGHCVSKRPAFEAAHVALRYALPINTLVHDFKFNARPRAGMLLCELMQDSLPSPPFDAILPVPMTPERARDRGFNQARWLAFELAQRNGLPMLEARRLKPGPSQRRLNRQARFANLAGAFVIDTPPPRYVAIVDDVVTTGATAHALALALRRAGAQRVDVWAAARTPLVVDDA
ncbi:ComF family protein [Halomonas sp. SH5A2]|uniref:ComF family protein n=1 Tax=Halomonas sp. SH5A2 TaxID=2749040 RepID=UPI0016409DE3|nr:double zinc ribbon domain-containing protein [Halomonas sp. SH5A2]QNI02876.1 ComF family protein [Halomonas sp. SH5A2]